MSEELKRDVVKYVRDKAKHAYKKDSECYICGSTEELDFHHYNSVTELLEKWLKENKIDIKFSDDIKRVREEFISVHEKEMYIEAVTICHKHHEQLHKLYGRKPALHTATKQKNWVEKQRVKNNDKRVA